MSITVVSCYYDISSKFTNSTYINWIDNFLKIPCNMHIFTDSKTLESLRKLRPIDDKTFYQLLDIENFHVSKYNDLWERSLALDIERKNGVKHTVELYKIWSEKIFMCKRAILNNVFRSDVFCWCDAGCVRNPDMFPSIYRFPMSLTKELSEQKIMLSLIDPFTSQDLMFNNEGISLSFQNLSDDISCRNIIRIQGGFFAGYKDPLLEYSDTYDKELQLFDKTKTFAGKDQYVMANILLKNPDKFQVITNHDHYRDAWFGFLNRFSNVPFVTCRIEGGLGNQLFQVSHALCLAWKNNYFPIFEKKNPPADISNRPGYWDTVLAKVTSISPFINCHWKEVSEIGHRFNEICKTTENIKLHGYWQSYRYFYGYDDRLREILRMPEEIRIKLENKIPKNCTGIHVRRADYIKLKWNLPTEYYTKCIEELKKCPHNKNFLLFSDDHEWCASNFPDIPIFNHGNDVDQLYAISLCDNVIMANSTFSWWGVFLNKNIKKVYAPDPWFPKSHGYSLDIYRSGWNLVNVKFG